MIHVKVLQHHIDLGVRQNAFRCGIAQALMEQFDTERVTVGPSIWVDGKRLGFTPQNAAEFVVAFDRGWPVFPFNFDIDEET
jgi:hypothetical protein